MTLLLAAALAASFDAQAALRHASSLAALGPHPWGSPRSAFAAAYVSSALTDAGLGEVRTEAFETGGLRGTNVVGILRGSSPEIVVVGAHHDTAPEAPGAYDDGGGVGVLIEIARVLAGRPERPRTVIFASWDGEEAWSSGKGTTTGSRAFLKGLGPDAKHVVAVFDIEMSGWKGGQPTLHPIAYADPVRPGRFVVAPAWLVRAALDGAAARKAPFAVGDPLISLLYQPAVRTFRAHLYGDDLSFLQGGHAALFAADSSFTSFYPDYHLPSDTPDKLDADALGRMGQSVLGAVDALLTVPRGPDQEPEWLALFGVVLGRGPLALVLGLCLTPGLATAVKASRPLLAVRVALAAILAVLFWRNAVPTVYVFALPALLSGLGLPIAAVAAGLTPLLALLGLGLQAWRQGMMGGTWLSGPELLGAALALGLLFVRPGARPGGRKGGGRKRGGGRKK